MEKRDWIAFAAGAACILVLCAVQLVAGADVVVTVHDQLDSEVLYYKLHAEHPLDASYGEMLGGIASNRVVMASPASVLLYIAFGPLWGFLANWCFVALAGYCGMWLCLRSFDVSVAVGAVASVLFALAPFYSVYGLSVMGVPLVLLAARQAVGGSLPLGLLLVVLYAAFSSPFLVGYAVVALALAGAVVLVAKGARRGAARLLLAAGAAVAAYAAFNGYALAGMFGEASQRGEAVLTAVPYTWEDALSLYLDGQDSSGTGRFYHAGANQHAVALFCLFATAVGAAALLLRRVRGGVAPAGQLAGPPVAGQLAGPPVAARRAGSTAAPRLRREWAPLLKWVAGLQALAAAIVLFYCFYHGQGAVDARNAFPGALRTFQLDRFYWLLPTIWYLCLGLSAEMLLRLAGGRVWLRLACAAAIALPVAATFSEDKMESDALLTVKAVAGRPVPADTVTWAQFFAEDAFAEMARDLDLGPGERVGSIGMHPSVAAYNGLACVDGYSNNYPLSYKHEFREVIAGELEASEALRAYFDNWANRCYLFQHEVGPNYLVRKGSGAEIGDLRLDLAAFAGLGGRYLLSAAPIVDCGRYGLREVGAYEAGESLYRIHAYEVVDV